MSVGAQNGRIAEALVELELLKRGWHVERLDGSTKAANGDLIAIRGALRPIIQVKSALSWDRPSFGHATGYLRNGTSFFNAKNAPISADFIVTVVGDREQPIFHVLPVAAAEELARRTAERWIRTPKRDGGNRSENFPVSLRHDDPALSNYKDAWSLLERRGEVSA